MNLYERMQELRKHVKTNQHIAQELRNADTPSITPNELYNKMNVFLDMIEMDIKNIEYNFVIENVDGGVRVFDGAALTETQLNEDICLFQILDEENVDIESLSDMLKQLVDANKIQGSVLLIPPNISVFKAKIAKSE